MTIELSDLLREYGDYHRRRQAPVDLEVFVGRTNESGHDGSAKPVDASVPDDINGPDDELAASVEVDILPPRSLPRRNRSPKRIGAGVGITATVVGLLVTGVALVTRGSEDGPPVSNPDVISDATTEDAGEPANVGPQASVDADQPEQPASSAAGDIEFVRPSRLEAMAALDLPVVVPPVVSGGVDASRVVDASGALATGGTPLPDVMGAVPGDDGSGPLPLGVVSEVPVGERLDFLFEFCGWYGPECFRDAHLMPVEGGELGSGVFTAGRPFHVRHGFVNDGEVPLGDGFDVVVYVTALDAPGEFDGVTVGETLRYSSDYVVRGEADRCGPLYRSQEAPVTCEWFVHEFADGLPEGRFAVWVMWEAPCWAWLEWGFTESCDDRAAVSSMFSSGYDGPFGQEAPSFTEADQVGLSDEEAGALFDDVMQAVEPPVVDLPAVVPPVVSGGVDASRVVDASGALATGGTPLPDVMGAVPGDDGSGPLPLGVVSEVPVGERLDFLFEFCGWYGPECFRDAHLMPVEGGELGSGVFTAGRPFHVRHGFVNDGEVPLGDGFDVVVYVTALDAPGEFDGVTVGETLRYSSDYVVRGEADRCGPLYRSQEAPVTCEWFVHEFADGLPEGRFAVWVMWEAPCWAWLEWGFTESCDDRAAVSSMFSSGYDGPFGQEAPSFTEADQAP